MNKTAKIVAVFAIFAMFATSFQPSELKANSELDVESPEALRLLEERIWIGSDGVFPSLENEVIYLLQRNPRSAFYHYLMAELSIRQLAARPKDRRLLKQASLMAQQAMDLDPSSEFGYLASADLLDMVGQGESAKNLLEEAANTTESGWRMIFALSRLSASTLPAATVLKGLRTSLDSPEANGNIILSYAAVFFRAQIARGSMGMQEKLREWVEAYPNPALIQVLAKSYIENGQYRMAHNLYNQILKSTPEDANVRLNNAIVLFRYLGRAKASLKEFAAIADPAKSIATGNLSAYYGHLAAVELSVGQDEQARLHFVESLRHASDKLAAIRFIDSTYSDSDKLGALPDLVKQINVELPGHSAYHAYLGEVYSDRLGLHQQALSHFADAIILDPNRSEYYNAMGLAHYHLANLDESLKLFSAATKSNPSDATAQYNKACALALLGDRTESLAALAVAVRLDPTLKSLAREDNDFSSIRGIPAFQDLTDSSTHEITAVAH